MNNPRQARGVRIPTETRLLRFHVDVPDPSLLRWHDAICASAPQTPELLVGKPSRVWGAEPMFEEVSVVPGVVEVQLIHFGPTQHEYHDLVAYAKTNYLVSAHPRHCLAVVEQFPQLREQLCTEENERHCAIGVPRAFPVTSGDEGNSVFNVLLSENGDRTAQFTSMWRRAYFWEWFAFIPVFRLLRTV